MTSLKDTAKYLLGTKYYITSTTSLRPHHGRACQCTLAVRPLCSPGRACQCTLAVRPWAHPVYMGPLIRNLKLICVANLILILFVNLTFWIFCFQSILIKQYYTQIKHRNYVVSNIINIFNYRIRFEDLSLQRKFVRSILIKFLYKNAITSAQWRHFVGNKRRYSK